MGWDEGSDWDLHLAREIHKGQRQIARLEKKVRKLEKENAQLRLKQEAAQNQARELGKILDKENGKKRKQASKAKKCVSCGDTGFVEEDDGYGEAKVGCLDCK